MEVVRLIVVVAGSRLESSDGRRSRRAVNRTADHPEGLRRTRLTDIHVKPLPDEVLVLRQFMKYR